MDSRGKATGQGALTAELLNDYILTCGASNFADEADLQLMSDTATLPPKILLTFDDGLLSQFHTAKPVLDKFGIKAFWFVYTKTFRDDFDISEITNYVAARYFSSFDHFFAAFSENIRSIDKHYETKEFEHYRSSIQSKFPFYSVSDVKFRFCRNRILNHEEFRDAADKLLDCLDLTVDDVAKRIWMSLDHLKKLNSEGHKIGLHSHSHPYNLGKLSFVEQTNELTENFGILKEALDVEPSAISYPLGSFNEDTLIIAHQLNLKLGFMSINNPSVEPTSVTDLLKLPRIDSALECQHVLSTTAGDNHG